MARNTPPRLIAYQEIDYSLTTATRTFASISWQTNDVVAVVAGDENSLQPPNPVLAGLSFSAYVGATGGSFCGSGLWTAVAASPGSGQVSIGALGTGSSHWGASLWQWRNSDGVGIHVEQHTATKTVLGSLTDTHSALCIAVYDFGAGAAAGSALTPTVSTVRVNGVVEPAGSYTVYAGEVADQAATGSTSFGITTGTASAGPFSIVGIEVLGTTTAVVATGPPVSLGSYYYQQNR